MTTVPKTTGEQNERKIDPLEIEILKDDLIRDLVAEMRSALAQQAISSKELAEILDVSASTVTRQLSVHGNPTAATLATLMGAIGKKWKFSLSNLHAADESNHVTQTHRSIKQTTYQTPFAQRSTLSTNGKHSAISALKVASS